MRLTECDCPAILFIATRATSILYGVLRLTRFISRTLLAFALAMGLSTAAHALAYTRWIEDPLPAAYRDAATALLKKVRPGDADRATETLKAIVLTDQNTGDGYFLVRVESACDGPFCMTLLGRISDKVMHLDVSLEAGPAVHFGDVSFDLWGERTAPPWTFETRGNSGLVAILRQSGWVLSACSNCTGHAVKPPPAPRPPPVPKFDTFEDFRRALAKEGLGR